MAKTPELGFSSHHAKLYSIHNNIFSDPWDPSCVYFCDREWNIGQVAVSSSSGALGEMQVCNWTIFFSIWKYFFTHFMCNQWYYLQLYVFSLCSFFYFVKRPWTGSSVIISLSVCMGYYRLHYFFGWGVYVTGEIKLFFNLRKLCCWNWTKTEKSSHFSWHGGVVSPFYEKMSLFYGIWLYFTHLCPSGDIVVISETIWHIKLDFRKKNMPSVTFGRWFTN